VWRWASGEAAQQLKRMKAGARGRHEHGVNPDYKGP
jgi:hypothetical protein